MEIDMKKIVTFELDGGSASFEFEWPMCNMAVYSDNHLEALFDLDLETMRRLVLFFDQILKELDK